MKLLIVLILLGLQATASGENLGEFSGRLTRVNLKAEFIKVKVDFANMKYLNKRDKLSFWDERGPALQCQGHILGKSNDYILIKVPEIKECSRVVSLANGMYFRFFSEDLVNNIKMGKELVNILLKKRLALKGSLTRKQKELDIHIEKVAAVNMRYKILRDKLEAEWRDEIAALEEDRLVTIKDFKGLETRLLDADHKLEKYRVEDQNLKEDRWALDSRLYYKK